MANALYPKLALTNLGKNKSTYFPYMLTSIVCIMTYYIMQSIACLLYTSDAADE